MVAISKIIRGERKGTLLQILHRFHGSSQVLQSADQDLNTAVAIYEFLIEFIGKLRTRFEEFEAKGKKLSECDHYSQDVRRVRPRNHRYDKPGTAPELTQTPVDKFRTGSFLVIIDNVDVELKKRLGAYAGNCISEHLDSLTHLPVPHDIELLW